ncbi:nucleotide-sensitive chloride conductance regulator (ICln) family protein [Euphorbia peplus]|nr:nucleotide-sensitive chloride conductance regulator (ICln) family protein [Euphorbia peplus]
MVAGLRELSERGGDGPVLDTLNGEELMHVQANVAIVLGNGSPDSAGTLYISSKKVVWLSDLDINKGYAVDFLSVSLHAISRDPDSFPSPCIYCQIDTGFEDGYDLNSEDSDPESIESGDISHVKEMRLIPSDSNQLDTLFQIFCECAELNPEPIDAEEEHNWIFSADQMADTAAEDEDSEWLLSQNLTNSIGRSNGVQEVTGGVLELHIDDQRFEDPEEMEHDKPGDQQ